MMENGSLRLMADGVLLMTGAAAKTGEMINVKQMMEMKVKTTLLTQLIVS